jgi:hypothetical protein
LDLVSKVPSGIGRRLFNLQGGGDARQELTLQNAEENRGFAGGAPSSFSVLTRIMHLQE